MAGVFIITGLWVTAAIILTVRCNEGAGGEGGATGTAVTQLDTSGHNYYLRKDQLAPAPALDWAGLGWGPEGRGEQAQHWAG